MAKKEPAKKVVKKPTTKPFAKAKAKTQIQATVPVEKTNDKKSKQIEKRAIRARKSYIILAIVIIVLGIFLYVGRGLFVAAVVNGQPISRLSIVKESEKQSGKQALETIIRNTLIEQEARKANVTVSDAEVDAQIKTVENQVAKQGRKLDDVLAMQGMTRDDLRKLIRLDKLVEKIVGQNVTVTDKEISDYIDQNKDTMPQDATDAQLRKTATDAIKQNKLNEKVSAWLAGVQAKAKVIYFVQY